MKKKKIIIIGAGIAGLTSGIYALDNNYDVTIYEKHAIVGGQCTGWVRNNSFIDGCAHWIVGTNPTSDLYSLWRYVGAFNENDKIYETTYYCKYDIDGEVITLYADINKLQQELLRVAPEDSKKIKRLINDVKAYKHVKIPTEKPLDMMNIFDLTAFGINMLPMALKYGKYKNVSIPQYCNQFKSKYLRKLFIRMMGEQYNAHSMLYILQTLVKLDAGIVEGGSKKLAYNIYDNFINKGGKVVTNVEIDKVLIEDNKAKGVIFKDGKVEYADYVICSTDAHHALYDLLDNKYYDEYFVERFDNNKEYPLNTCIYLSFKINEDVSGLPKMLNFEIPPIEFFNNKIDNITIRNYSFDASLSKDGSTVFSCLIPVNENVYDELEKLDRKDYLTFKDYIGKLVKYHICKRYNLNENNVKVLDVATPLTYNRYTNAYKGSYMSFLSTNKAKGLMRKGLIKGLDNFVLAGQWLMPPGGLPIALFMGKHAIIRICKMDKKKFVNLDYVYKPVYLKKKQIIKV